MKTKMWWIVLLGSLAVGAIVYFAVFAQGPIVVTLPLEKITFSCDDVYWLLIDGNGKSRLEVLQAQVSNMVDQLNALSGALEGKLNEVTSKLDALSGQVAQVQSVVGSVSTTVSGTSIPVSTGLAQLLYGEAGVGYPHAEWKYVVVGRPSVHPLLYGLRQLVVQLWDKSDR